jgi:HK97 family phage prohead protease
MLEQHGTLDTQTLQRLKAIAEGATVEHLTLKALTTVSTDEGTFEAVISTESVDREKDIVDAGAMVKALRAWIGVGKLIPLAWEHSTAAEDIIGHIKPDTVKAVNGEVIASGWIDQSTERGKQAWRLVKSGTLGFSFGYLTLAATKRSGGGLHITELDVFEVSGTMVPMNSGTRVLGWKSHNSDLERFRLEVRDQMLTAMSATDGDTLRAKSQRVEREFGPVQVAELDVDANGGGPARANPMSKNRTKKRRKPKGRSKSADPPRMELEAPPGGLTTRGSLAAIGAMRRVGHVLHRPVVQLGNGEIGYCMYPERLDDCLRPAIATATQIAMEQIPDPRLDERWSNGEDLDKISADTWNRLARWLYGHGLRLTCHDKVPVDRRRWVGVVEGSEPPPGMAFADWQWRDNPFLDHCVVAEFDRLIFDPAISLDVPRSRRGRLRSWTMADVEYGLSFDSIDDPIERE